MSGALLDELLEAYRATPCAALHALLVRASAALAPPTPDALRGRLKPALEAWTARAKAPSSAEVPALLETLADGGSRVAVKRIAQVNAWKPDPRVDEQIVKWIETPPWEGDIAKPFWRLVFQRAEAIRDPGVHAKLVDEELGGYLDSIMYTWVRNLRTRTGAAIAKQLYDAKPPKDLARHSAAVDAAIATPKIERSESELLAAIYEHPDDTATRLVYADALIADGDPRGEFIVLQCASSLDAKRDKLAAALLKKHGSAWLGPLVNVVMKHYVFERGFLARCVVAWAKRAKVPAVVGHPMWSTVRAFGGSTAIALDPIMRSLRELSFWGPEDRTAWKNLLVDVQRPIEHLAYVPSTGYRGGIPADEFEALGACTALPALRSLSVSSTGEEFIRLLAEPITRRLHGIHASTPGSGFVYNGEPWVAAIIAACKVPVLELRAQVVLRVEQTGDITFTLTDPRQQVEVATAMVQHLPRTTKRVTIRATADVTDQHRAAIAKVVRERLGDIEQTSIVIPAELPNQVGVVI